MKDAVLLSTIGSVDLISDGANLSQHQIWATPLRKKLVGNNTRTSSPSLNFRVHAFVSYHDLWVAWASPMFFMQSCQVLLNSQYIQNHTVRALLAGFTGVFEDVQGSANVVAIH